MKKIKTSQPWIDFEEKKNISIALKEKAISGFFGSFINTFEKKFSNFCGAKYGVSTSSGTTALHLAVKTLGIGSGDEVIVTTFTNMASIFSIIYTGARPVIVDIDETTFNINPNLIEKKITKNTKAIMVVHIFGHPVDFNKIKNVANKHNLLIIEDCAEAHGAEYYGKKVGSFIHFGVREFAMFAIANGLAATGLRPFVSTFLVFADYGMSAIRMAALMKLPVIFVLTHDSIAVGEDGPTHQPVEQLSHLRGIPNLKVWRPCDRQETLVSWCQALADERNPSCLVLSRQALPQYSVRAHAQIVKGGYRLCEDENPVYVVLATGSEVSLAVDAWRMLRQEGVHGIVVSLPCMERFLAQPKRYQEQVLPSSLQHRIAIEAGIASVWHAFSVPDAHIIAIKSFGASGKGEDVRKEYGLTSEHIMLRVKTMLAKSEQAMLVTEDPI